MVVVLPARGRGPVLIRLPHDTTIKNTQATMHTLAMGEAR